jgi:DNA-binding response OmpR family regulator
MAGGNVARVLVVDDEPEIRQLLADALKGPGIHVESAANGQEALRLGRRSRPDFLVADVCLGDTTGLDVVESLRGAVGDFPAVVITGCPDVGTLTRASRLRPVEVMTKPLDLDRLRQCVRRELAAKARATRDVSRARRLRRLARHVNLQRKSAQKQLDGACSDLAESYRSLSAQVAGQQIGLGYQRELLAARCDDDVFRSFFRLFVRRGGPVFGVALVCDSSADLQIIGRFGVPGPDSANFCQALSNPVIELVLANPKIAALDAGERSELFDPSIRKYLVGLTVLAVPLMPASGEMIGLVLLYRKGEQPFTEDDTALAELVGLPTAIAVKRND